MLKEKVAIVTGGTRGIGRAIAIKLAQLGANIVINYRSSDKEAEEVKELIKSFGVDVVCVKCDISDFEEAKKLIDECKNKFGKLDILINNAGITKDTLVLRMKEEDFDNVINVNLKGTFNCSKHASAIMLKQRSGKIINLTSVVGVVGNAGQANYAASKAGVIGLTKSLAKEFGARGINVNAVAPGFIKTDMTAVLSDTIKEEVAKNVPLKKLGEPEDIANLVAFLASDSASYITGQVINVDGGMVI
ncbi:3-oxoacyl-[acyl-carrier-protein] reductase [Clostridium tarantellae]|uniref:3-oxoacyl-[acyl-carrier-protein] reductase n=1 Tax=Clostridium tarantellae TaxID=39493 RepID=A0A6I1MUL1_9CLOT|nr:3-oxoacyl-[acyl-carrier-protein] reductase [Clostridium tarantellae]MPQ43899.1 3-oxoacyl-[acyl-carrier-protein] reductase [Clostridium tarantellae]